VVDDVIATTLGKIKEPGFEKWCNGLIDKNVSAVKEPDWDSKEVKAYGKEYFESTWQKQLSFAKKSAVTACINKAFGDVIGGGCTNNPHAPESVDKIDREVIEKTLDRIRYVIRKGTVQRAYSRGRRS
jgi:hypothetical protein